MQVLKFDPFSSEESWVSQSTATDIRNQSIYDRQNVIMCENCNSILHHSITLRLQTNSITTVYEVISVISVVNEGRIFFLCNKCQTQVAQLDDHQKCFKVDFSAIFAKFDWTLQDQKNSLTQEVVGGCLSGLSIEQLQGLMCSLIYLKCQRYQSMVFRLDTKAKAFFKALNTFANLVNLEVQENIFSSIKDEEEDNFLSDGGERQMGSERTFKVPLNIINISQNKFKSKLKQGASTTAQLDNDSQSKGKQRQRLKIMQEGSKWGQ